MLSSRYEERRAFTLGAYAVRNLVTWVVVIGLLGVVGYFIPTVAPDILKSTGFDDSIPRQDQALADCRSGNTARELDGCSWLIENSDGLSDELLSLAHHNRGLAHANRDDHDQAFADYDEAIRLDPDDYITYYMRGYLRQHREEYDAAITDYTQAIGLNEDDPDVFRDRALARYYLGEYEESLPDLYTALKMEPDDAATLNSLAWTLLTLGRAEEAMPISAKSLEEDGQKYSGSLDTYAHILAELGRQQEAFEYFIKAARVGDSYYVRTIQEALAAKGYLTSAPDGVLTGKTREALKACIAQNCRLQLNDLVPVN